MASFRIVLEPEGILGLFSVIFLCFDFTATLFFLLCSITFRGFSQEVVLSREIVVPCCFVRAFCLVNSHVIVVHGVHWIPWLTFLGSFFDRFLRSGESELCPRCLSQVHEFVDGKERRIQISLGCVEEFETRHVIHGVCGNVVERNEEACIQPRDKWNEEETENCAVSDRSDRRGV